MSGLKNYYDISSNIEYTKSTPFRTLYKSNEFDNTINYFNLGLHLDDKIDYKVLMNDNIPGPVKNAWRTIKQKIEFLKNQNKLNTIYINDYLQRDNNYEMMNFIKYTWDDIQVYNLSSDILDIFKTKLTELSQLIKK